MLGDDVLEISKPKDPTVVGTGLEGKAELRPKGHRCEAIWIREARDIIWQVHQRKNNFVSTGGEALVPLARTQYEIVWCLALGPPPGHSEQVVESAFSQTTKVHVPVTEHSLQPS